MLGATWDPHWHVGSWGLLVTIARGAIASTPFWRTVFSQFAPELAGKYVPVSVTVRGAVINNARGATLEDIKQFMREAINNVCRM
jgi:hypothetical protein